MKNEKQTVPEVGDRVYFDHREQPSLSGWYLLHRVSNVTGKIDSPDACVTLCRENNEPGDYIGATASQIHLKQPEGALETKNVTPRGETPITIHPEQSTPAACPLYQPGDVVCWTNDYGVKWHARTILSSDDSDKSGHRYYLEPHDAPWMSVREENLAHETLTIQALQDRLCHDGGLARHCYKHPDYLRGVSRVINARIEKLEGKVTRTNGDVVDDVMVGQNVVARVQAGNYLPVCVVDAIPEGSSLLDGAVNPNIKHWSVRHLGLELSGQVVPWPARDLFQNVSLAQSYDKQRTKPKNGMSM